MITLKTEKRDTTVKAKKLRREGYTTGILFGKEMEETIPLQMDSSDTSRFLKTCREGSQVILDLEGKKISAITKSIDYDPMKKQIMALDFQALVSGEKIASIAQIKFINEEFVQGFLEKDLSEVHYKATPEHLVEEVTIDLKELSEDTKSIFVKDLKEFQDKDVDLVTPEDSLILHIADHVKGMELEEEAAPEGEAAEAEAPEAAEA